MYLPCAATLWPPVDSGCIRLGLAFKTGYDSLVLASLEFVLQTRLASNLCGSSCLCLPSAGVTTVHHLIWLHVVLFCFCNLPYS